MQPLIQPLYGGRSAHEVVAAALESDTGDPYKIVRNFWQAQSDADFEEIWRRALHHRMVAGWQLPPRDVGLRADFPLPAPQVLSDELVAVFHPDPGAWDGRFNNNGWLQELPRPFTKLTWDSAALLSPLTAERLGVQNEEVLRLRYGEDEVLAPVFVLPGKKGVRSAMAR
jgi:molybdopterin-containing oxidoreductase family iron-sulfur binding subunit